LNRIEEGQQQEEQEQQLGAAKQRKELTEIIEFENILREN
jgi:hypothetical protein